MADCAQLAELYEAYALGALDGPELAELEAHLARACPACTPGVERARLLVANLAYLAPDAEPSASVRRALMESIRNEADAAPPQLGRQSRPQSQPQQQVRRAAIPAWAWTAAAALLLFSAYMTFQGQRLSNRLDALQDQQTKELQRAQALVSEQQRYQQALAIVAAADTRHMQLKPSNAAMPPVTAYWNPQLGLALAGGMMPALASGRTLQLWIVPQTGAPISAGIFHPDASGQVLLVMPPAAAMNMAKALAISDEPAGGSPQPTTTPGWVAPIA